MSSTQRSGNSHDEENNITEPTKASCKHALGDDPTDIEDEDLLEDQEIVDSYEFVEADYHSYTDVASSVSAGSSTNSELSDSEDEIPETSESEFVKKEKDHGEARKGGAMGSTNKETDGAGNSDDKDRSKDMKHKLEDMPLRSWFTVYASSLSRSGGLLWRRRYAATAAKDKAREEQKGWKKVA